MIDTNRDPLGENPFWLPIRALKQMDSNRKFKLEEGDTIKLGRIRLRVKEIQPEKGKGLKEMETPQENAGVNTLRVDTGIEKPERQRGESMSEVLTCRICLSEGDDNDNPFICPCDCSGTMKYVHVRCLQQWLSSRTQRRVQDNLVTIAWKSLDCELCKKPFEECCSLKGKRFYLIDIPRPETGPYVLLEILSKEKSLTRGVHIFTMHHNRVMKIGRGHDADIRIPDISVSRIHASLRFDGSDLCIDDNNSKFGTLLLAKEPVILSEQERETAIQVGRTVFHLMLEKTQAVKFSLASCFSSRVNIERAEASDFPLKRVSKEQQQRDRRLPQNPNLDNLEFEHSGNIGNPGNNNVPEGDHADVLNSQP
eukprot:TRINITY_DN1703_c0_g1_i5.p1 TRINITY_DN1703_c0_g1~~TRINITY_DN1703_c0_g1_i5.p1  ORF type:complete len:367 (-),score=49.60 TRINITY_DN1703_c0_g1_i5:390-1490(-)